MTQIKPSQCTHEHFFATLGQLITELRDYEVHFEGGADSDAFSIKPLSHPRTSVALYELFYYMFQVGDQIGDDKFHNSDFAHEVQEWVYDHERDLITDISFDPQEAKESSNTLYFYDVFKEK